MKIKNAGIISIYNHPVDILCLKDLMSKVDWVTVWLDKRYTHRKKEIEEILSVPGKVMIAKHLWKPCSGNLWREPLLRSLDEIRPEFVLQPDSDETFGPNFDEDFTTFKDCGLDMMMFNYKMMTEDGTYLKPIPRKRHCKIFRWKPSLKFKPYRYRARPRGLHSEINSKYPILHYAYWNEECYKARKGRK